MKCSPGLSRVIIDHHPLNRVLPTHAWCRSVRYRQVARALVWSALMTSTSVLAAGGITWFAGGIGIEPSMFEPGGLAQDNWDGVDPPIPGKHWEIVWLDSTGFDGLGYLEVGCGMGFPVALSTAYGAYAVCPAGVSMEYEFKHPTPLSGFTGSALITMSDPTPGADGATGSQGIQGSTGLDGATGSQGLQGTAGLDGATGSQGIQGFDGAAGADGATGSQGIQGSTGLDGATGSQGIQGLTGDEGPQGIPGDPGGPEGPQGIQGVTGDTGLQGNTGPQGIQGAEGLDGSSGADGATGPQGIQGAVGEKGDTGDIGGESTSPWIPGVIGGGIGGFVGAVPGVVVGSLGTLGMQLMLNKMKRHNIGPVGIPMVPMQGGVIAP